MPVNLGKFLSQDLKIESNVVTENLDTISRYNLISRVTHRDVLDSVKICQNIQSALKGRKLSPEEERCAKINLQNMQIKFSKSSSKGSQCNEIINQIFKSLNPQPAVVEPRKSSPRAHYGTVPAAAVKPAPAVVPAKKEELADVKMLQSNPQFAAIKALRDATGKDTRSQEEVHSVQKSMVANLARMKKIAMDSGVTEAEIRTCSDFGHFIQYNGEWSSVTIRKEVEGGIPHLQRVLVKAEVVKTAIDEIRRSGKRYDDSMFLQHAKALGLTR